MSEPRDLETSDVEFEEESEDQPNESDMLLDVEGEEGFHPEMLAPTDDPLVEQRAYTDEPDTLEDRLDAERPEVWERPVPDDARTSADEVPVTGSEATVTPLDDVEIDLDRTEDTVDTTVDDSARDAPDDVVEGAEVPAEEAER